MQINWIGIIIKNQWLQIHGRFNGLQLDSFVVMPNHFHGIIKIEESLSGQSIGKIVGAFKSLVANEYIKYCKDKSVPAEKLWQRNYYEHIIRDEDDYYRIVDYIQNNPMKWDEDQYR